MPRIPKQRIYYYSVGVTDDELRLAKTLLNRKKITVDADNVDVFKKLRILPNCEELMCIYQQLQVLPELPNCRHLYCSVNQLVALPVLPQCTNLNCSNNQITELPELPNCTHLVCSNNELIFLPPLPHGFDLDCKHNQITELPELPECFYLDCSNNQITQLPELPNCVELDCSYNQITVIPPLPHCPDPIIDNNPILPVLPQALYQTNRAWWNSQQQRQLKQQIKHQLTQQQKRQIQKTDPISLQQFQSPALGDDFSIYDDSTLARVPFKGMRGLQVTRSLPLKQAVQKYKTQQDPAQKARKKKDIAKYVALLQMLQTYGLEDLFANQF